jgi:hypothetical protein
VSVGDGLEEDRVLSNQIPIDVLEVLLLQDGEQEASHRILAVIGRHWGNRLGVSEALYTSCPPSSDRHLGSVARQREELEASRKIAVVTESHTRSTMSLKAKLAFFTVMEQTGREREERV